MNAVANVVSLGYILFLQVYPILFAFVDFSLCGLSTSWKNYVVKIAIAGELCCNFFEVVCLAL